MENDERTLILPPTKTTNQPTPNEIRLLKIKRENLEMISISHDDVDFIMQEIQKIKSRKKFIRNFKLENFCQVFFDRCLFLDIPSP